MLAAALAAVMAAAAQAPASLAVVRTDQPPAIDGRLDDAAWQAAQPIGGFLQREPREGEAGSERTEVRVIVTAEALYVAAWLFDRTPDLIVTGEKIRDAPLTNGDYFAFILDTYHDRQNGFMFATTPAGIEYDGQVIREGEGGGVVQQGQTRAQAGAMGGFNLNWDGSWTVATSRDSAGWYAEFRIPFATLRYGGSGPQTWGANFVRSIRRHNEDAYWAPIPRQYNLYRLSRAGTLDGIPVPSRRAATLTPYVLGAATRDFAAATEAEWNNEFGADAKLGITPSLTLDLTYNTDFAQVEVDEAQTNLTRFPLFFPEKRPFFLENGGTFSVGTPQAVELFFSRQVGIAIDGRPVPITGGGRVTGKAGGVTVGLLQLFTDGLDTAQVPNSYTVARLLRELPNRSRVGAMFVQRLSTDSSGDYNRTYGGDARIGLGEAFTIDTWFGATETPGLSGRNTAFASRFGYLTRDWNNFIRYTQVGEAFNPEVGFLSRSAYRAVEANVPWIRQLNPHVTVRHFEDFSGFTETGYLHIDPELEFAGGGIFGPEFNFSLEGLRDSFEVAPGVIIPPGTYRYFVNGWDVSSNPSLPFSFRGRLDLGEFYDGHRWGGATTFTWRPAAAFQTSLGLARNWVYLPQGDFTTELVSMRAGYFFTPRIFFQGLLQFNTQTTVWSGNLRFGWLNTAGTGLYLVYNDAEYATSFTDIGQPIGRSFTLKYTKQFDLRPGR